MAISQATALVKEQIERELEGLDEVGLRIVADFIVSLKFQEPHNEIPKYDLDELLAGITEDNIHPEVDYGPPVGKEFW